MSHLIDFHFEFYYSFCLMCQSDTETLKHLFYDCSISRQIWNDVRLWIASKTGFSSNLSP